MCRERYVFILARPQVVLTPFSAYYYAFRIMVCHWRFICGDSLTQPIQQLKQYILDEIQAYEEVPELSQGIILALGSGDSAGEILEDERTLQSYKL